MAVQFQGNAGVVAEVDEARNLNVNDLVIPGYPSAGGFYSVTGSTSAAVAASLAANTALMTARFATGSTRKAYITRIRVALFPITPATAASTPGSLGFQRFTAATPTGGTARTVNRMGETKGSATDMTDVRDNNAALTGGTFGNVICQTQIPVMVGAIAAGMTQVGWEWVAEFSAPVELAAGDGVSLRTQVACPATATWGFSYNLYWFER